MTSYRTTMRESLAIMNEDNLEKMRKAAGGAKQTLKMKDGSIGMDSFTASAIMQIYDKVNDKNRKTMENLLKDGKKADIVKLMKFAMSKVNAEYVPEEFEEEFELVLEGGNYKSKEDAMSAAADAYAKQRDPLDEIEVYKMSGNKFEINHPMNSAGRDSIQKRGGKLIAKVGKNYKEEVELDEAKMSAAQIAKLKKAYEPMRGKKISMASGQKLSSIMDKVDDDKQALIQLVKADIPFVSQLAVTRLITKHGMKGAEIRKMQEEVELGEGRMKELHGYIEQGMSAKEIAKKMKLDVKTIQALMPKKEEVEEGAAADARRAMRGDPDMRQRAFSKDDSATDDERKAASKNIMMQMRKAVSLRSFDVEFSDGKKVKIPQKVAQAVLQKYNSFRKPADKEKYQAKVGKSYKDMLAALKEGFASDAQRRAAFARGYKAKGKKDKKESTLERMNKKIQEKKNG